MRGLAVFVILAALNNGVWSAESDCSDNNPYIRRIKEWWQLADKFPSGIIEMGVLCGPDNLRKVTPGYRPDINQIDCVETYWETDNDYYTEGTFYVHLYYKNGNKSDLPGVQVTERAGQTIQTLSDGQEIVRTHINTDEPQVSCFYKCDPRTSLNPPQAVCKVYKGYSKAALDKAVRDLEIILGVRLSVQLSGNCMNHNNYEDWCVGEGIWYAKGDTYQAAGQCVEVTCQGNNVSTALGCPLIQVDAGWTISEEDPTKSYPDCCPQPIPPCDIDTNTTEDWCEVEQIRYAIGYTYQVEGQCVEVTCQGNNVSTALGCPLIQVDAGWTISEEDPTKSYPDCCPQPIPPCTLEPSQCCVEEGVIYQVGEHRDIPGWCGANICLGNNEWTLAACPLIQVDPGWTLSEEDLTRPYPDCCPQLIPPCDTDVSESDEEETDWEEKKAELKEKWEDFKEDLQEKKEALVDKWEEKKEELKQKIKNIKWPWASDSTSSVGSDDD